MTRLICKIGNRPITRPDGIITRQACNCGRKPLSIKQPETNYTVPESSGQRVTAEVTRINPIPGSTGMAHPIVESGRARTAFSLER